MIRKQVLKVICIILGITGVLIFSSKLLMPVWNDWNTDDAVKGFYKEPSNTVQVLFLGQSGMVNGISPILLYNGSGICSYNLATPQQPMLASYYWLREVQRLHAETLQTVVLDVSSVFVKHRGYAFAERALAHMHMSPVRIEAIQACDEEFEDFHFWDHILPLTAYHTRWDEISEEDFISFTGENDHYYSRGQNIEFEMSVDKLSSSNILTPSYKLTPEQNYSFERYLSAYDKSSLVYFNRITEFCRQKDLDLVLVCIPKYIDDLQHDAMQYLADQNGIPFIDFNMPEILGEIGLNFAFDYIDRLHPNYFGAEKISGYIGRFLKNSYEIRDIRGDKKYKHMEKQAEEYSFPEEDARLLSCESLTDYLEIIGDDRFTTFLTVKSDGISGLSEQDREKLSEIGFVGLADLKPSYSYVGIKDRKTVVFDEGAKSDTDFIIVQGRTGIRGGFSFDDIFTRSFTGDTYTPLKGENLISVISAGSSAGNRSSVNIDGNEYSDNGSGLNFVVYDNTISRFVDSSNFEPDDGLMRRMDPEIPKAYIARLEKAKLQETGSLREYVAQGLNDRNAVIIFGTNNGSPFSLDPEDITFLRSIGLADADKTETQLYAAVICEGSVIAEDFSGPEVGDLMIMDSAPFFYLISGRTEENMVIIENDRWTVEDSTVFVVICSQDGKMIIDWRKFS